MEKQEKYGFVYIWYDRKHKRYYIGAHWGTETDGYICSSNWMRDSYKRRSEDFKRRILSRIYTTRKDTFIKEQEWLDLIKLEEIRIRYYNLQIVARNNWKDDMDKNLSRKEKMSKNHWSKTGKYTPYNKGKKISEEHKEKILNLPQAFKDGHKAWNKGIPRTEEQKRQHSEKMKGHPAYNKGKPMSEEQKLKISITKRNRNKEC
ncbi:MAG: hypothetical protein P4L79_09780 [Legionella sp.]|uniref:hypothetical protein n=1 Tax=Legionella sp. TaxID=459 RepID=UPI002851A769|nr:hypothetical protein [Legionella sp.]